MCTNITNHLLRGANALFIVVEHLRLADEEKKNSQTQSSDACTIVQNEKKNDPEKCHINDDEHQQNGNKIKLN